MSISVTKLYNLLLEVSPVNRLFFRRVLTDR